jgi:DNA polymerase-3 subunit epsilon
MNELRFAIFDTETTGFEPGHVLQVAVVVARFDGTIEHQWSSYVKRRFWKPGHLGAYHVHGITRRTLRGGIPIDEVLTTFEQQCAGAIPVAHNASFDVRFLRAEAERLGRPLALDPVLCTLTMSRALDAARKRSHKLVDLAQHYGVADIPTHDALADSRTTAAILPHLLAAAGVNGAADLAPYLV